MKKTVTIENVEVEFASNGRTMRLYRMYFKKDMLADLMKFYKSSKNAPEDISEEEASLVAMENMDFETVENLSWICAKTANNDIPDIDQWLEQFEDPMSLFNAAKDVLSCVIGNMENIVQSKKNLNKITQK